MSVTSPPFAMSSSQAATATAAAAVGSGCCGQSAGCSCPACQGLASLVRPRFFAGQVLTEVDLMALEHYAVDAHRLHNRYLHGAGVVCGLDLSCENCGDGIAVCPGYALDPCGRDLVVPSVQQVDVGTLIAACLAAERSAVPSCDPPMRGAPQGCDDDQHWCLTLRYKEVAMRPVTPLAGSTTSGSSSSSCCGGCGGCGGGSSTPTAGWSCTCGQGGSRSTGTCGCSSYVSAADLPPGCEPTRIAESFEFGVCRCDGSCCSLSSVLAGTLPEQLVKCVQAIKQVLDRGLNSTQQEAMVYTALGNVNDAEQSRTGMAALYSGVLALYQLNPCRTTCTLPREFEQIDATPQQDGESDALYSQRLVAGTRILVGLVVAYLRDCMCHALNPPCPTSCDDRVVLGCFTYTAGAVGTICNIECRRYAGSFTSRDYWLPIAPVALWALGALCCFPLTGSTVKRAAVDQGPIDVKADVKPISGLRQTWVGQALDALDPTGNYRRVLAIDDFAAVKSWPHQARVVLQRLAPAALRDRFTPSANAVSLASLEGKLSGDAEDTLTAAKVQVEVVEVNSPADVPVSLLGSVGVVEPGAAVIQYIQKGRVIGYARAPHSTQAAS